ncbi:hypothetical protein BLOT_003818 [Blomia tropicalis]|nr:hypothetical protein BLOT_003818 [Blomia tropicalis]
MANASRLDWIVTCSYKLDSIQPKQINFPFVASAGNLEQATNSSTMDESWLESGHFYSGRFNSIFRTECREKL